MRDNAFSCHAVVLLLLLLVVVVVVVVVFRGVFLRDKLICSEKLNFSSIMAPSTLTQASDDKQSFPRVMYCSFRGTRGSKQHELELLRVSLHPTYTEPLHCNITVICPASKDRINTGSGC